MLISDIAVRRPVFALVLNLLIVVLGVIAFTRLPLREYPDIDPPIVSIQTSYRGASANIVETRITQPIEDRISGVEGLKSIESTSRDGQSSITLEFELSRDIDAAANDVRDAVSRVLNDLPVEAEPPEVSKANAGGDVIMWLNFSSDRLGQLELTDYAERYLVDRLSTVEGVAQINVSGGRRYALRVWVDRTALAARGLTVADVERALRAENVELPAGRIESVDREFTVRVARAYRQAEDFRSLVLGKGDDGHIVRLGEVADVELGAEEVRGSMRTDGREMVGLGIRAQSRANTLGVAQSIRDLLPELNQTLPEGATLGVTFDSTIFIEEAINEVYFTLGVTVVLVLAVIFLFLGNLRATAIPAVTVPVSLLGGCFALYACGMSINLLTLLALVLAIGLVVDDAIVVLENLHRRLELGEPPLLAAYRGVRQVGFAVVATTAVLVAVFVPIGFLTGNVGRLFGEFAVAMAAAVAFSSIVALTLSPVMGAAMLRHHGGENWFSRRVDAFFRWLEDTYAAALRGSLRHSWLAALAFVAVGAAMLPLYHAIPQELMPAEDRGTIFVLAQGPEGQSLPTTLTQMTEVEARLLPYLREGEAARMLTRIPQGFGDTSDVSSGRVIMVLEDWRKRQRDSFAIADEIQKKFADYPGMRVSTNVRGGLRGFGRPVQIVLCGSSYQELAEWRDFLLDRMRANPGFVGPDSDYKETKPQFEVEVDRARASDLGVPLADIGRTLETMLGSRRVTTITRAGEEYDVLLQARDEARRSPSDLANLYVRSLRTNELVPLSNLVTVRDFADARALGRFNRLRAITVEASLAPGYALGDALQWVQQEVAQGLPGATLGYKGQSRDLMESTGDMFFMFGMALLVVYLVLGAQFESFIHPFVIIMTVPLALAGALLGLYLFGSSLNIYSQIGIVMLVGLATKNGILIVEFANQLRDQGRAFVDALVQACRLRLRPILMTSVSTAVGALPLIFAHGAGAESRFTLGVVIFAGVLFATLLTLFIVPAFYFWLARFTGSPEARAKEIARLDEAAAWTD